MTTETAAKPHGIAILVIGWAIVAFYVVMIVGTLKHLARTGMQVPLFGNNLAFNFGVLIPIITPAIIATFIGYWTSSRYDRPMGRILMVSAPTVLFVYILINL
jgi:hypothetical protein